MSEDQAPTLRPTELIDADHPEIQAWARAVTEGAGDQREKAVRLYEATRDGIRYDPYNISLKAVDLSASATLARGRGFCVPKATLLAAGARAVGIPSRLGFADVRNHLATRRLIEALGTDLFAFHGYTELELGGRWVKATPTFNAELCERFGVDPLPFDGENDALFQQHDRGGNRYMEYVRDRGHRDDVPLEEMRRVLREHYPGLIKMVKERRFTGDFAREASEENPKPEA